MTAVQSETNAVAEDDLGTPVVSVSGLTKRYGTVIAVDAISFSLERERR
jgi:hypothetical protein